tara:strand:+ start:888 stop:1073 length:186 start_codon:yes stop_codon:yes gene_type:complete
MASYSNCMMFGNCITSAWFVILVPLFGSIIIIIDYLSYFDNLKIKVEKAKRFIENKNHILA